MFYPKSKYSDPKHTPGNEFLLDGKVYVGWYVETFKKQYLTGKVVNKSSKRLVKISTIKEDTSKFKFENTKIEPTDRDRENGVWVRYFLKDKRTGKIIETTKQKFVDFKEKTYVLRGKVEWVLKGPADNVYKEKYVYYGASHKNELAIKELEKTIQGITKQIKNYSEFVE